MSDHGPLGDHGSYDQEIHLRGILLTAIVLAALTAVSIVGGFYLHDVFLSAEEDRDLEPTPISATTPPRPVPMPRLQASPPADMARFRAQEQERLEGWGWVDESAGVAHIPVQVAIELVARDGLPTFAGTEEE